MLPKANKVQSTCAVSTHFVCEDLHCFLIKNPHFSVWSMLRLYRCHSLEKEEIIIDTQGFFLYSQDSCLVYRPCYNTVHGLATTNITDHLRKIFRSFWDTQCIGAMIRTGYDCHYEEEINQGWQFFSHLSPLHNF